MIGTFIFWQTSAKPEEERESIYRGEEKNFTETQSLRYCVHPFNHREDHIGTLPTLSQKATFYNHMMPQVLFKDVGGSSHVGACNTHSN